MIACTIVFGWMTAKQLEKDARFALEESLKTQANILQQRVIPHLRKNKLVSDIDLSKLTLGIKHRVTLINAEGRVLADNRKSTGLMEDHSAWPEIVDAGKNYFGISERLSEITKENTLFVCLLYTSPSPRA